MSEPLARRLADALETSALAKRFDLQAESFLARRAGDPAAREASPLALRGLARVLASSAEFARYLAHRPALFERIARAGPGALEARACALEAEPAPDSSDLELFLDNLRLLRRDETAFAACLDLAGAVPFEDVSEFLSRIAETCVRWSLRAAEAHTGGHELAGALAVVGMGKIAGRRLTYASDLDVVFLYDGSARERELELAAPRIAQRLIHYLGTMTAAGVAYAVDSRLRPSGGRGALVTTHAAFEDYQCRQAATWEHLALMRSRELTGSAEGQRVLERTRERVLGAGRSAWSEVADMRARVETQRGRAAEGRIPFKTGTGGLMEVEFLATGARLERGDRAQLTGLPAIAAMLRATAPGPACEALLADYAFLRRLEARVRWVHGRALEQFDPADPLAESVAELVEPGLALPGLLEQIAGARERIRSAYQRVIGAGSIGALTPA